MDDHLYDELMKYAEVALLPKARQEYKEVGSLKNCKSDEYNELKDLLKVLNIIAPYAGYEKTTVKKLLD